MGAKKTHCWIYMATLNSFILSTALSAPMTIKYKYSHGNNGKENAPHGNAAHTLSIVFRLQVLQRTIVEKSMWNVRQSKPFYCQLNSCWSASIYASQLLSHSGKGPVTHKTPGMLIVILFKIDFSLTVASNNSKLKLFKFWRWYKQGCW